MRVSKTDVRGVGSNIFYVDTMERREKEKDKNSKWIPAGYQIRIKGFRMNPLVMDNWPTNDDLSALAGRYR